MRQEARIERLRHPICKHEPVELPKDVARRTQQDGHSYCQRQLQLLSRSAPSMASRTTVWQHVHPGCDLHEGGLRNNVS